MAERTDLQAVFARFLPAYQASRPLDGRRQQVTRHIGQCRTPALGGRHWQCDRCDYGQPIYFACRDRHCPRCQQRASRRWAEREAQAVLPVAGEIDTRLAELMGAEAVVYAKPCLGHTETVVGYLARYSHRIAISNARILGIEAETVAFRYTDYADDHRTKVMRLAGVEFVRRFLLHVLPKGFMRIRHYGFLANRCRCAKLERIGECLNRPARSDEETAAEATREPQEVYPCPACDGGVLRAGALLPPSRLESG